MEYQEYILYPLQEVVDVLTNDGFVVEIVSNNHNVNGDTKLVTNIELNNKDKIAKVVFGEFVFNLKSEDIDE